MAKPLNFLVELLHSGNTCLLHGKTSTSWQKPLSFLVEPLPMGNTFLLHG
jgi:hypothetical protein